MKSTRCYLSRNQTSALFDAEDTSAESWLGVNCYRGARGALFAAVLILFICTGLGAGVAQSPPPASFLSASLLQFSNSNCAAASLATGDFNQDGKPDLIVIGDACTATADIFLANGDGTFSLSQAISPLTGSQGAHDPHVVAVADFNGDGHLDFAVALQGGNFGSLDVYLGDGTGHFTFSANYSYGSRNGGLGSIAIADVNGDGKPDLVVGNGFEDGTITVMFGNGDGTFQGGTVYACCQNNPGYDVMDVAIADFNNDGHPDIAVADQAGGIDILLNKGDGTFQAPIFYSEPSGGAFPNNESGIAAADLNHDGNQDVVLTWNGGFWVYLGKGDGTFNAPVNYNPCGAYGCFGSSVAVADINGDNKLDVIMSDAFGSTVWAFLGNGDGTFQPGTGYATDFFPQSMVIADFNGDGKPDFAVGNDTDDQVTIAFGNGDGTFQAGRNYDLIDPYASSGEVAADFNNDGYLDVATWGSDGHNDFIRVMLNNSHGVLGTPIITTVFGCCTQSITDMTAGDVNGDGKVDLIGGINETNPQIAVFLGKGDGTFQGPVFYSSGSSQVPEIVALADLRNNGNLDILVWNSDGSLSVLLNAGNGTFGAATVTQNVSGSSAGQMATGDFNGDGKLDLALEDEGNSSINILLGNGDGTFQSPSKVPVASAPQGIAVGDFNRDGKLDVAAVGGNVGNNSFNGGGLAILLGNGDGTFGAPTYYNFYTFVCCNGIEIPVPYLVAVADVNLDGMPDLLVAYENTHVGNQCCYDTNNIGIGVFLGNGDGTFEFENPLGQPGIAGGPFLVGTGSSGLVVGDFNGDGAPDAAVLNSSSALNSYDSWVTMLLNTTIGSGVCTSTTLGSSANPAAYGQAVMLTATVVACEGSPPTGPVTFFDGGIQLGTATLAGDQATLTISTLGVGSHSITAIFGGNRTFKPSASPLLTEAVNPIGTYTLTVTTLGTGNGTVTDNLQQINCTDTAGLQSGTCSATYNAGTTVDLTATPVAPATFGGWGGACTGTGGCSVVMNSAQSVTASFAPQPPTAAVAFSCPGGVYPCSNVTAPPAVFNCPSGTNPCTDPNAHSLTLTAAQINSPFTLTVEANEVPTSQANGDCSSGQTPSTDFDCRFTSFFAYETLPNGDTIVPACDAYSNGNCVFYSIYYGTKGNEPPEGDFNGPIAWSIAWNNTSYPPPPGYPYQANNPRLFYDPDYEVSPTTPYGTDCSVAMDINGGPTKPPIYCQFVFDITTYYDPTQPPDAGIGGKSQQFSDVVVAFPLTIAAPHLTVTKTADQSMVTAGNPIGYTITMSNSSAPGTGSATNATLTDPLPAGSGVNWSISPAYSGQGTCTIGGAPPSQTLTCALGNLSPAISFSVHVSSSSSSAGTYNNTATFAAVNNALQSSSASIQVVQGSGGGVAFAPTSINFGNVDLGSATLKKQVTMKNIGTSSLTISNVSLTLAAGTDPDDFGLKNFCPSKLAVGESCAIALFFYADSVGTASATLNVTDNALGSPQQVSLSATVINPLASFNPTSLSFSKTQVGKSSTLNLILTNIGTTTLNIASIGVTGADAGDFTQSNNCPSSLAATAICKISVIFTPTTTGYRSAKLTMIDNTKAGKQNVTFSGQGSK